MARRGRIDFDKPLGCTLKLQLAMYAGLREGVIVGLAHFLLHKRADRPDGAQNKVEPAVLGVFGNWAVQPVKLDCPHAVQIEIENKARSPFFVSFSSSFSGGRSWR